MKPRILALLLLGLFIIALGGIWFSLLRGDQETLEVFPATIQRDCAPWDGPAFAVSIPYEPGSFINISIWQAPDIKLPARFSFPDETMRIGNATFLVRFSYSVQLTGAVLFWRVEPGSPVEGQFDLVTESGQRLRGRIRAEWEDLAVYCG